MARILVVEDNLANRKLLAGLLAQQGYEIVALEDAEQILEETLAFRPDLILMDLRLPGRDGYSAIEILRRDPASADIPIVVTSAYALPVDTHRALELGVTEYFSKPLDIPRFLARIGALTGEPGRCQPGA